MVRPIGKSLLSGAALPRSRLCWRTRARAATSIAGLSRKLPACCCEVSREQTSRSSTSSPAHACRKNPARSACGRSSTDCSRLSTRFHRSEAIAHPARQFAIEPGLGGAPVAHHGDGRDFEHLGRFFHVESAKEAHFDDLHFAGIEPRQRVHRVIERHHVRGPVAAHHGRRLQAVAGALVFHVAPRQAAELVINDGGQPFESALVSVAPGAEERAYVAHSRLTRLCRFLHRLWVELYRRARSPQITAPCVIGSWRILRLLEQRQNTPT